MPQTKVSNSPIKLRQSKVILISINFVSVEAEVFNYQGHRPSTSGELLKVLSRCEVF